MNLLIQSAMARTQRDFKVTICHYLWMGNHLHMILVVHDGEQCKKFYMELQKKITDALKRLLGKKKLSLWQKRPMVAEILDRTKAIERIVYFYLNAARAALVESIEQYPGLSSYSAFKTAEHIESTSKVEVPWIRLPAIPEQKALHCSRAEDHKRAEMLRASATASHELVIMPNAWMKTFAIESPDEIQGINQAIAKMIQSAETGLEIERKEKGLRVFGAERLKAQNITWEHEPKKNSKRIFVLASDTERRISYIRKVRGLARECRDLYRLACRGARNLVWPPGMFLPAFPMQANSYTP